MPPELRFRMVMGVVIADAGPLIALARIGQLDLPRQLFGAVTLTSVVAEEIGLDRWGEIASARAGAAAIAERAQHWG